jgi:hypothetical protein
MGKSYLSSLYLRMARNKKEFVERVDLIISS